MQITYLSPIPLQTYVQCTPYGVYSLVNRETYLLIVSWRRVNFLFGGA